MKEKVNIGILYGNLYSGNMGCNALTYSTVAILQEVARRLDATFRYTFTEAATSETSIIPEHLDLETIDVLDSFYKPLRVVLQSDPRTILASVRNSRRRLLELDLCFSATAGDSFSDIYGKRFYYILRTLSNPINKNIPLVMLPQTIGPFLSEKAKKKAAVLLRKAHAVFTRDPISADVVRTLSLDAPSYDSVDMAFFLKYTKPERSRSKVRVGINPSGLLWNGGYTKSNQFNLVEPYPEVIRRTIEYFYKLGDVQIELVAHVLCGPYFYTIEDDYRVCKLLQKEYPGCSIAPYFYDPVEAKSHISGLDFLIASRMHCCIAAYSSGVPVLPFAYSPKFGGLFRDGLGYEHIADLTKDDLGATVDKLGHTFACRESISAEMPARASVLAERKEELILHLTDIVGRLVGT